jgi:hypothetical protein
VPLVYFSFKKKYTFRGKKGENMPLEPKNGLRPQKIKIKESKKKG